MLVGVAGYYFQQLTDDRGPGATLGGFGGMSVGIGPQIGFPVGDDQGYLNIKGYRDLAVENRPEGCDMGHLRDHPESAGAAASTQADHPQMIDAGDAAPSHDSRTGRCCGPRIWPTEKRNWPSGSGRNFGKAFSHSSTAMVISARPR